MKFEEAKPFLKEGMKVKVVKCDCFPVNNGEIKFIKEVEPKSTYFWTMFDSGCFSTLNLNDELEILTEADGVTPWKDPRKSIKPKVGQKVLCISITSYHELDGKVFPIEKVNFDGTFHVEGCYISTNMDKYELLPDEPEVKEESKPIQGFKIGDKVRCIDWPKSENYGGAAWKKGFEFTVNEITDSDDSGRGGVLWCKGCRTGVYADSVEKVTEEPKENPYPMYKYEPAFELFNHGFSTKYTNYYSTCDGAEAPTPKKRLFNRKESKMDSLIQAVMAKLSSVDRALVKKGYLDSKGKRTSHYEEQLRELALQKLVDAEDTKEFRKELAGEIKADKEEDEE